MPATDKQRTGMMMPPEAYEKKDKTNGSGKDRHRTGNEIMVRQMFATLAGQLQMCERAAVASKYGSMKIDKQAIIIGNQIQIMKALMHVMDQLLLLTTGEHEMTVIKKEDADAAALSGKARVTV